mgnify:CR=1 FL=1
MLEHASKKQNTIDISQSVADFSQDGIELLGSYLENFNNDNEEGGKFEEGGNQT